MKISVVTTLYYSQDYIAEFYKRTVASLQTTGQDYEIIFVNDGSPDNSLQKAYETATHDERVKVIDLSRNFGHHRAIVCGLEQATGDYIYLIDSDLEEAPEYLENFWKAINDSSDIDVVYGIQEKRKGGFFEKYTGQLYYHLFNKISDINYPANTFTARLMKKKYVEAVLKFRETELDLWCIFILAGFNQQPVMLSKGSKGKTTYTLMRKLKIAVNTITSVSNKPLFFIFILGLFITLISFIIVAFLIIQKLFFNRIMEGWTGIIVSLWFLGGLILFCTGIIGIYLSKVFLEVKNRPHTIIKTIYQKNEISK